METGDPILEELTQELERANQEIMRLKGYTMSTGLASQAKRIVAQPKNSSSCVFSSTIFK